MTWVVAGNTPFCPFIAGDVRVSFANGVWRDCLLKIHPIGPSVIGGFAGSVYAGFSLLDVVRKRFRRDPHSLLTAALDWIPAVLRDAFGGLPEGVRDAGCHLVFIGVDLTRDVIPTIPQPETFRFASPTFEPERAHHFAGFFGIGSGTDVDAYAREASSAASSGYLQKTYQAFGWTGPAQMLAQRLERVVRSVRDETVSPFFTFGTVGREGMVVAPYNYTERVGDGPETPVNVPPVARTWQELCAYCDSEGLGAVAAVASALPLSVPLV